MWSYKKSVLHVFWKNALATSCVKTRPKALRKILERDQYISSKIVVTQSTTSYRMKDMDKIFLTIPHKPIWVKWFSCYSTSNGNLFLSIWRDDFPEYFVLYARKHQDEKKPFSSSFSLWHINRPLILFSWYKCYEILYLSSLYELVVLNVRLHRFPRLNEVVVTTVNLKL